MAFPKIHFNDWRKQAMVYAGVFLLGVVVGFLIAIYFVFPRW